MREREELNTGLRRVSVGLGIGLLVGGAVGVWIGHEIDAQGKVELRVDRASPATSTNDPTAGPVVRLDANGMQGVVLAGSGSGEAARKQSLDESGRQRLDESVAMGEVAAMLAQLAALPQERSFVAWARNAPEDLRSKLIQLLLVAGEFESALAALGSGPEALKLKPQIANALHAAGRSAEASEIWRGMLAESSEEIARAIADGDAPNSWKFRSKGWPVWLEGLANADPTALVAQLEQWSRMASEDVASGLDMYRAQQLFALGRGEEAKGIVNALIGDPYLYDGALELLLEHDPARGEEILRAELALGSDPETRNRLMFLLQQQGRTEEFQAMLDTALQSGENIGLLLQEMAGSLSAEQLSTFAQDPQHAVFLAPMLAAQHAEAGRWDEAARAYDTMVSAAEQGNRLDYLHTPPEEFYSRSPAVVWGWAQRLEMAGSNNDEVWGDIGDMWRRLGEVERARQAYERAYELDPGDGEWTGNLRRMRRTGR